jgi:hypothetical protein
VRQAVRRVDPDLGASEVITIEQVVADSTSDRRLNLMLFALLGRLALVLAAVGVHGSSRSAAVLFDFFTAKSSGTLYPALRSASGSTCRHVMFGCAPSGVRCLRKVSAFACPYSRAFGNPRIGPRAVSAGDGILNGLT